MIISCFSLHILSKINNKVIGQLTSRITSKVTTLDFTLMHWGANIGIACNKWRAAATLDLAVVYVKVLSGLTN